MDRPKSNKKNKTVKGSPRVPIKTYHWEDVRRARKRGGYPWTHLYKQPYEGTVDPEDFTMEALSKSKSSSTIGKESSDGVEIHEVLLTSEDAMKSTNLLQTPEPIVTQEDSANEDAESENESPRKPEIVALEESAESSDNVSQYLDKEYKIPSNPNISDIPGASENRVDETPTPTNERARSEEPKKKRKLSVESSYSRISLSKLSVLKKLKDAKEKIKLPKISFPTASTRQFRPKKQKKSTTTTTTTKTEQPKKEQPGLGAQPVKPVYIHIPLKPPEGQTDEFSYLEFGEKKPEPAKPKLGKFKALGAKLIQEAKGSTEKIDATEVPPEAPNGSSEKIDATEIPPEAAKGSAERIDATEILPEASPSSGDLNQSDDMKLEDKKKLKPEAQSGSESDEIETKIFYIPPGTSSEPDEDEEKENSSSRRRARSAEPERKRKLSIDSAYSRISLSKLGVLKKLQNVRNKIKFPKLSLPSLNKSGSTTSSTTKKGKLKKQGDALVPLKKESVVAQTPNVKPVYIHIPLKPPPGEIDEFSHLDQSKPAPETVQETPESPASTASSIQDGNTVQFIFLTAPSDDEVLDDHVQVPDTPSSITKNFFDANKLEAELKTLAKDAVEKVSPESKKKMLEAVEEVSENTSEKLNFEEASPEKTPEREVGPIVPEEVLDGKVVVEETPEEIIVIDEEDGLKSSETVKPQKDESLKTLVDQKELKSVLKSEGSPVLKKKVSFKRKAKVDPGKDYEEVCKPEGEGEEDKDKVMLAALGTSQSMSVDEEKMYLDQKIMKTTSLEEDYNRWSKLSDHEYEPVNPPDERITVSPMVVESYEDYHQAHLEDENLTAQEMQTHIEDRFFSPSSSVRPKQLKLKKENTPEASEDKKPPNEPSRFQQTIKTQTDKIRTKLQNIKKPNIHLPHIKKPSLPSRPKFRKPNFERLRKLERPKLKMPDMPSFHLPRKTTKQPLKETRQFSTESNAGDSTKHSLFDFSTYPRIFKRKQSDGFDSSSPQREPVEFATVPRTGRNGNKGYQKTTIRIPLHSEDSMEAADREDSVERRMASHTQYDKDIEVDDDYERENQEIHMASPFSNNFTSRWNHGSFHPNNQNGDYKVTDLDSPEDFPSHHESFDTQNSKDVHSSQSSLGLRKRGVLEEINSDEFFLRQKGISQEYIDSGKYLSSEIREAFASPLNALSQIEYYDTRASNQSLPETPGKRKPKKPKRKKTPHPSQEQIPYDQEESELDENVPEAPPSRPKRRSKRRAKKTEDVVPYQETIPAEETFDHDYRIQKMLEQLDFPSEDQNQMYENEQMEGRERPDVQITDPYKNSRFERFENAPPPAPPKRQKSRSLKSLTFSEQESILGELQGTKQIPAAQNIEVYKVGHDYIIPAEEILKDEPLLQKAPERPQRNNRPRTRSQSLATSQGDDDIISCGDESLVSEPPCIEEPCVQDIRDHMGYAIVDKNKPREPPLPPPKVPSRNRRPKSSQSSLLSETKFSTVPRSGAVSSSQEPPVRPLRNYSTLGPSNKAGKKLPNLTDEEKENIDITQYIEIEDEPNRDLHSGEVIQKMRDRPLPAPPRPPRKGRALKDITSQENVGFVETEVSTQTEPLPDDFVCEEVVQEAGDVVLAPTTPRVVERRLITPTQYTHEETITHGSLVVEPLNGAEVLKEREFSRIERRIPVTKDYSDEETSEVPESFRKLRDPPAPTETETLKTHKLQVSDLDVDRLNVNELLANKIVVSEIDSSTIQANEISAKSGAVKIGELELPPSVLQQLFEKLQAVAQAEQQSPEEAPPEEKKTPIEPLAEDPPQRPPRQTNLLKSAEEDCELATPPAPPEPEYSDQEEQGALGEEIVKPPTPPPRVEEQTAPQRPPRQLAKPKTDDESDANSAVQEPEVDDEAPPPRPPQPNLDYFPSQPPASFYALRAEQYVNDDIPMAPRRRRQHHHPHHHHLKAPPVSRSSSSEEEEAQVPSNNSLVSRRRLRSPDEASIPHLTGQLVQACGGEVRRQIKRLISHFASNVLGNADGKQDTHVVMIILLVLIAGILLLSNNDGQIIHHHHWEFFNPPRDL